MTRRVLRYTVRVDDGRQVLELPRSPILHVACRQSESVDFWMEADVDSDLTLLGGQFRTLLVVPTGGEVPADMAHVGSCVSPAGTYVWHLYCRPVD
jgi:hypothetical protein